MTSQEDAFDSSQTPFSRARLAASSIRTVIPQSLHSPHVAIVCGSGLNGLQYADIREPKVEIKYNQIPGMPQPSVEGHEGKLVFGFVGGRNEIPKMPILLLVGRAHFYEGHSMELVTFATRVCHCLDVKIMIVTNAAGGLNPSYNVGDIVLLNDHLNLAGLVGVHPLRGPNETDIGVRFPSLSDAYDLDLRRRTHASWRNLDTESDMVDVKGNKRLHEGVYAFVGGPTYETRAECRMLKIMGADVVGMSTVPEVIVARHSGMRILAMSLVTNKSVLAEGPRGDDPRLADMSTEELQRELEKGRANHEEVIETGNQAAVLMRALIVDVLRGIAKSI